MTRIEEIRELYFLGWELARMNMTEESRRRRLRQLSDKYAPIDTVGILLAEVDRLRAALERMAELDQFELHCDPADFDFDAEDAYRGGSHNAYCEVAEIAREALKES